MRGLVHRRRLVQDRDRLPLVAACPDMDFEVVGDLSLHRHHEDEVVEEAPAACVGEVEGARLTVCLRHLPVMIGWVGRYVEGVEPAAVELDVLTFAVCHLDVDVFVVGEGDPPEVARRGRCGDEEQQYDGRLLLQRAIPNRCTFSHGITRRSAMMLEKPTQDQHPEARMCMDPFSLMR